VLKALPKNRVLADLPAGELALLLPAFEAVQIYPGDIIDKRVPGCPSGSRSNAADVLVDVQRDNIVKKLQEHRDH
jgi:hypothetical protein